MFHLASKVTMSVCETWVSVTKPYLKEKLLDFKPIEKEGQTDRQTERETDRQTDRHTDRHTDRQKEKRVDFK